MDVSTLSLLSVCAPFMVMLSYLKHDMATEIKTAGMQRHVSLWHRLASVFPWKHTHTVVI